MGRDITRTKTRVLFELEEDSDADRTSDDIDTGFASALIIVVVLDNEANTAGFTPILQGKMLDGSYYDIHSFTELTADGTYVLMYSPHIDVDADAVDEAVVGLLPETIRVVLDYSTGTPATDSFDTYAEITMVQF